MANPVNSFAAAAFALSILCVPAQAQLTGGEPIAADGACQIYGGMVNIPLGVFPVGDKSDCFAMLVTGVAMDRNGVWLYEPDGEASDGAPLYKKSARLSLPPEIPVAKNRTLGRSCLVKKLRNGEIWGFWSLDDKLMRSKYDAENETFVSVGKPLNVGAFRGIVENTDGSLFIYTRGAEPFSKAADDWLDTWNSVRKGVPYLPFDGQGIWRGGIGKQFLFVQKLDSPESDNISKRIQATKTRAEGIVLNRAIQFVDADGIVRLFCGTDNGNILHYIVKADGTLSEKKFCRQDGGVLRTPAIAAACALYERDGKPNLIVGGECGLYFYKFEKFDGDGNPHFAPPLPVRSRIAPLYCGSLPVVSAADIDGDGLADIVAGNSMGQVVMMKNTGRSGKPKFREPRVLSLDGEPFSQKGGYWNVQGPGEAQFGYVCPTLIDWNGDGLLDLVTGDNSSRFGVYLNAGTKKAENFRHRKLLMCDGLELFGSWRQRPAAAKLTDGSTAYVMLDEDDQLRLYRKIDNLNLADCGKLKLVDGKHITSYGIRCGEAGRIKLFLYDIDGDGATDILVGSIASSAMPEPVRGIPRNLVGDARRSSVLYLRNAGSDKAPVFEYPRLMRMKTDRDNGKFTNFGWHSCSASVADFGRDEKGILVGSEEGQIYFFNFKDIVWEDYDKLERAVIPRLK